MDTENIEKLLLSSSSIYVEALWVLALFAATAILREAFGELCVHVISRHILSASHITGKTLDTFISCSNSGRSLGFGAAWRLWNIDNSGMINRAVAVLPFSCWIVGLPIKLVAVSAVRGGNPLLGKTGTWALGGVWIAVCLLCKLVAIIADRRYGVRDTNGKIISYRKIFQARFCRLESYGMMMCADDYDSSDSFLVPKPKGGAALGVDCKWVSDGSSPACLNLSFSRRNGQNDATPNGIANFIRQSTTSGEYALL